MTAADPRTGEQPKLSLVIPVYNEEQNVARLHQALCQALDPLPHSCEIVLVNDGSRDNTAAELDRVAAADDRVTVLHLRRNFGQTAAMSAGFDHARGAVVIVLDADLQNDPADIPRLLAKLDEGYDVVSGRRAKRQDKFLTRRLPSLLANWLISRITGVRLHDYGCSLKAYRREILQDVALYGEMHRFLPALCYWAGARITELDVTHHPRQFGKSKYGLSRIVRVLLDLITVKFLLSYATKPSYAFGLCGLVSGAAGFALALYLSYEKLFQGVQLGGRPALLLAILLMLIGVQFITMGLLAEMLTRTYYEAQGKRIYAVRRIARGAPPAEERAGQP